MSARLPMMWPVWLGVVALVILAFVIAAHGVTWEPEVCGLSEVRPRVIPAHYVTEYDVLILPTIDYNGQVTTTTRYIPREVWKQERTVYDTICLRVIRPRRTVWQALTGIRQ